MPNDDMQILEIAANYCEDGRFEDALPFYDKFLKNDKKNVKVIIDKGVTLQNLGRNKEALTMYDNAILLEPGNLDAQINKGSVLHTLGLYDKAIQSYDFVLNIDSNCAMALAYKGLSLSESGKIKEGLSFFLQ